MGVLPLKPSESFTHRGFRFTPPSRSEPWLPVRVRCRGAQRSHSPLRPAGTAAAGSPAPAQGSAHVSVAPAPGTPPLLLAPAPASARSRGEGAQGTQRLAEPPAGIPPACVLQHAAGCAHDTFTCCSVKLRGPRPRTQPSPAPRRSRPRGTLGLPPVPAPGWPRAGAGGGGRIWQAKALLPPAPGYFWPRISGEACGFSASWSPPHLSSRGAPGPPTPEHPRAFSPRARVLRGFHPSPSLSQSLVMPLVPQRGCRLLGSSMPQNMVPLSPAAPWALPPAPAAAPAPPHRAQKPLPAAKPGSHAERRCQLSRRRRHHFASRPGALCHPWVLRVTAAEREAESQGLPGDGGEQAPCAVPTPVRPHMLPQLPDPPRGRAPQPRPGPSPTLSLVATTGTGTLQRAQCRGGGGCSASATAPPKQGAGGGGGGLVETAGEDGERQLRGEERGGRGGE